MLTTTRRICASNPHYPYGEEITGTSNDTYKYAQLYRDSDSGLDYATNRYYANGIGRFLSVDRGGMDRSAPQSWNRYAYTANDPVNYVDTTGEYTCGSLYVSCSAP